MAEIGVKIELAPLESAAYLEKVVEEPDFDLAWFGGGSYGSIRTSPRTTT